MSNKAKILLGVIILVIVIGIIWYGVGTKSEKEVIKVGAIVSLTGPDSYFGDIIHKGMVLANKDESVELIVEDFGSETKNAPTAVNKLVNVDGVDVLLTEWSEDTLASIAIIEENKIPTICVGCGTIGLTEESEYLFRVWPSDELEVNSLIEYAESNDLRKAAVLQTISVWEESLTEAFKDKWEGDVLVQKAMREDNDFRTQLLKIKEFEPDFIYLACYEQKYPIILRQIRELGIDAEIGSTSWINDPTILESCSDSCNEVIVPQYSPASQSFMSEYRDYYGEEAGIGADVAYDVIKILSGVKTRDKDEIRNYLLNVNYKGASGKIEFDSTGDRKDREVDLYKIENQELNKMY